VSPDPTALGYLVLAVAAVALEAVARISGRIPTMGRAVATINKSPGMRWLLVAAWLWAGWHLFVRASWG
jgi:hypothetical protein